MRTEIICFRNYLLLLLPFALLGCQEEKLTINIPDQLPKVFDSRFPDSSASICYQAEEVMGSYPSFIGKFPVQANIDINPEQFDSTHWMDRIDGRAAYRLRDSISMNGFEIYADYEQTVKYSPYYPYLTALYEHYPVFIVNNSKQDKLLTGKDRQIFGIQEAYKGSNGDGWKPIEYKGFDFCGNGRWSMVVHPNEFALVLMRKYAGDYITGLRLRFKIGESIYVSAPFKGFIDQEQFNIPDSSHLQYMLRESKGMDAFRLFYGAVPIEEDWAVVASSN